MSISLKKYCYLGYYCLSTLIFCGSFFNFAISPGISTYIFDAIYLMIFACSIIYYQYKKYSKIDYLSCAILILVIFTVKDYLILICSIGFFVRISKNIRKFRWLYVVFLSFFLIFFCLSLLYNIITSKQTAICSTSLSGSKVLSRDVYDVGGLGYKLTYIITEKYGMLERKYVVAARGQMENSPKDNYFLDEVTLKIQGIIYNIGETDVTFKYGGDGSIVHRSKRMSILFLF